MEPPPFPANPASSHKMLHDLCTFVGGVANPDISYSSVISIPSAPGRTDLSVELKSRDTIACAVKGCDGAHGRKLSRTFRMIEGSAAVKLIWQLVACSTWTHAQFVFYDDSHFGPGLHDLIVEIFSLLRLSRSLSTLDIQFELPLYHRHLPALLCENPSLQLLILTPSDKPDQEFAEGIALCFSRNSILKSCKLVVNASLNSQAWEVALRPFTTSSKSEANVALKELVLQISGLDAPCEEAIVNLVRCNTTLEKLEVRSFCFRSLAKALVVNHILKEFGCACDVAHLKELFDAFIPGFSGHQATIQLTTLKLFPTLDCQVQDYMRELSRMLELNTTLKHVEVASGELADSWIVCKVRSLKAPGHEKVSTRGILESMMRNELRLNTSLQSLVVGHWTLLRVGGEWQISYGGPCLFTTAEYDVKVQMHCW